MKKISTKQISYTAMFTALIFAATLIQIRMAYGGNINLGDTMILLCATVMGPIPAMIAGSIGAAACDLAMGYAVYAPFTFVIKALEGLICGLLIKAFTKKSDICKRSFPLILLTYVISALVMVSGYFVANAILIDFKTSLFVSVPFDLIQAAVSVFLAIVLVFVAKLDKLFNKLYNNQI